MGPEAKLYQTIRKATPNIIYNRVENLSVQGMPDALCYNKKHQFFTDVTTKNINFLLLNLR